MWRQAGLCESRVRCGVDQHSSHHILRASSASSALALKARCTDVSLDLFFRCFMVQEGCFLVLWLVQVFSIAHRMRTPKSCQGLHQRRKRMYLHQNPHSPERRWTRAAWEAMLDSLSDLSFLIVRERMIPRRRSLSPTAPEPTDLTLHSGDSQLALYVSSVWVMLSAGTGCQTLCSSSPKSAEPYVVHKMQRNITDEVCSCLNIVTLSFRSSSLFCVYRFSNEFWLNPELLLFDLLPFEHQSFRRVPVQHSFDR